MEYVLKCPAAARTDEVQECLEDVSGVQRPSGNCLQQTRTNILKTIYQRVDNDIAQQEYITFDILIIGAST